MYYVEEGGYSARLRLEAWTLISQIYGQKTYQVKLSQAPLEWSYTELGLYYFSSLRFDKCFTLLGWGSQYTQLYRVNAQISVLRICFFFNF